MKSELLKEIKNEVLNLKESPLYAERIKNNYFPVIGEGNHNAKIIFIGEAPGKSEAKTGRPFCGSAGKVLDKCLKHIFLERSDVYITNILKDRPPQNRDPSDEEIEIYAPFLDRQIDIIKPKIIATLGRFSTEYILRKLELEDKIENITKLHGKTFNANLKHGEIKIVSLFHPAVAVYSPTKLKNLQEGFSHLEREYEKKK